MKLLLDEMHAPGIADALVAQGHDVVAVAAMAFLRGASDADLFDHATRNQRALITENVGDFSPLALQWASEARTHAGLIFTNPKRFNRASLAYPGNLIGALGSFLDSPPVNGASWTWWL
jgi:hypothetical protein